MRILEVRAEALAVPLVEPFTIATGRMDATRAALVRVVVEDEDGGARAEGLGEGAALPPVTEEDQDDVIAAVRGAAAAMRGVEAAGVEGFAAALDRALAGRPVARAAVECALVDAAARLGGLPVAELLGAARGSTAGATLTTDITLPIAAPAHMARLAAAHAARGFACFKVKIGRDAAADVAALRAVHAAVPGASFRLDANAGFAARDALVVLEAALAAGLAVECYEQPCAREDWAGMAEVTARSPVAVVADESCRGLADVERIINERAAGAVNLKLVKLGGPLGAARVARRARAAGLGLMAGAMVETRLGLVAMAHVVHAVGGVDWVDLDTAFLLAEERFTGGWAAAGPRITLSGGPGLDVRLAA